MKTVIEYIDGIRDNGAETLVKDYCLLLDKNKFRPIVLVHYLHPESKNQQILIDSNIKIIAIHKRKNILTRIIDKMFRKWYFSLFIQHTIRKEKASILHIHMANLQNIYLVRKHLKGIKILYTCHSLPERYFSGRNKAEFKCANELIKNNNLQLIAINSEMVKTLNNMFNVSNTKMIKNGIDFSRFNTENTKQDIRKKFAIPENAFVLGQVGNLSENKNHLFTIDVFSEIIKIKENAYLILVGAGEMRDEILRKVKRLNIEDRFILLEHRSDIPDILKMMDAFVFPSKYEGLGIALIEAQKIGLKCIVSDTIPKDAFVSERVITMNLNDSPKKWANTILTGNNYEKRFIDINEYDMRKEILKLQELYS